MSSLIHLDGVTKIFYTEEVETHALSDINMQIATGEFVSIAGPSGSGKTTLLSLLGLLDTPSGGKYVLNGTGRVEKRENLEGWKFDDGDDVYHKISAVTFVRPGS